MLFCHNGTEWTEVWEDHGINRCFFESVSSAAMFFVVFTLGTAQCAVFFRHGFPSRRPPLWPWACKVQVLLTVILIAESVAHMILQDLYLYRGLCGSNVLTMFFFTFAYLFSLLLLRQERNNALPSIPDRRHGVALLALWCVGLVRENLAFVSWNNSDWWWQLQRYVHEIENMQRCSWDAEKVFPRNVICRSFLLTCLDQL